ncbi:hypothetical protein E2K93_05480 [Thalassotalea sp. HSM 43]|uniref:hypothetical protein n=1 Tax=Thalassotalea sp. HSM 43 TaxID=2552945 RepID=UPI001080B26E|nr:hypothetical protein [Thalassotalea sp. HSM 43]QBY03866.1 hypothetical protein E2K93_05480 [Thalassotalea sp. HSM 43]
MSPIRVPIKMRPSQRCQRCGLSFPKKQENCHHCHGLSDREVEQMLLDYEQKHKANSELGKLFIYISVLIGIAMLLALL